MKQLELVLGGGLVMVYRFSKSVCKLQVQSSCTMCNSYVRYLAVQLLSLIQKVEYNGPGGGDTPTVSRLKNNLKNTVSTHFGPGARPKHGMPDLQTSCPQKKTSIIRTCKANYIVHV